MSKRIEQLNSFYGAIDEDARLASSRHGQLEYATTMEYIARYVPHGAKVLELGAGTGRYSIELARRGYQVTAVELVPHNIEILRANAEGLTNLTALQGDATDLSRFPDESFDAVLVFGPLYHLYEKADVDACVNEALRVTRRGGVVISAFLSVHAILYANYLQGNLAAGLEENFAADGSIRHFEEQLFTGYQIDEFEALWAEKQAEHLATVSADSLLELAERRDDFRMDDAEFRMFLAYHLSNCERRELLGCANHLLYLCERR